MRKQNPFDKIIKSQIKLTILSVIAVILLATGVTYALYQTNHVNSKDQVINIGNLSAKNTKGTPINLVDIYPMKEEDLTDDYPTYTFSVQNDGSYNLHYTVSLRDNTLSVLSNYPNYTQFDSNNYRYIMYKLDNNSSVSLASVYDSETGRFNILEGSLNTSSSPAQHTIKFWISSDASNSIEGSVLSLDLYFDSNAIN